jgi:hypothetical protein
VERAGPQLSDCIGSHPESRVESEYDPPGEWSSLSPGSGSDHRRGPDESSEAVPPRHAGAAATNRSPGARVVLGEPGLPLPLEFDHALRVLHCLQPVAISLRLAGVRGTYQHTSSTARGSSLAQASHSAVAETPFISRARRATTGVRSSAFACRCWIAIQTRSRLGRRIVVAERFAIRYRLDEERDDGPPTTARVVELQCDPLRLRGCGGGDDEHHVRCLDLATNRGREGRAETRLPLVEPCAKAASAELSQQAPRDDLVAVRVAQEDGDPGLGFHSRDMEFTRST